MKLDDFEPIRTVGTGSYGRVILVQDVRTKEEAYAIKVLSKERVSANSFSKSNSKTGA